MSILSNLLAANKTTSFFKGFFSIYNLTPSIKNPYEGKTDAQIIHEDWKAVGGYLQGAINQFDDEHKIKHTN